MKNFIIIFFITNVNLSFAQIISSEFEYKHISITNSADLISNKLLDILAEQIKDNKLQSYTDSLLKVKMDSKKFEAIQLEIIKLDIVIVNDMVLKIIDKSPEDSIYKPIYLNLKKILKINNPFMLKWLKKCHYKYGYKNLKINSFNDFFNNIFESTYKKLIANQKQQKLKLFTYKINKNEIFNYCQNEYTKLPLQLINLDTMQLFPLPLTVNPNESKEIRFQSSGFRLIIIFNKNYKTTFIGFRYGNKNEYRENFEYPTSAIFLSIKTLNKRRAFNKVEKYVLVETIERMRRMLYTAQDIFCL